MHPVQLLLISGRSPEVRQSDLLTWGRVLVYCVAWLPPLVVLFFLYPRFAPGFQVLKERGELPALTRRLGVFVSMNEASCYLLTVLALIALLIVDQAVMGVLERSRRNRSLAWWWVFGVAAVGLLGWLIVYQAFLFHWPAASLRD